MRKIARRDTLKLALATPFIMASGRSSFAQQNWPTKPIQIILPFGAGGGADVMVRIVCARASEVLKQPFIIENKTGGSTVVAASAVLALPHDGYTFFNNSSQHIITPLLTKDLPFDYATSFVPVSKTAAYPQAISVRQDFPGKTLQDLIAYAKDNPGKLRYGTPTRGGMGHLAGLLIELRTKSKFVNVPYRNAPDVMRDLAGGQLDVAFVSTSTVMPFLSGGKVRVIGVTSPKRIALMPEAQTVSETIVPGYDMDDWSGLFAAAGTPEPIINRMQEVLAQVSREPAIVAKFQPLGTELVASTPKEFATFIDQQRGILTGIVKEANLTE